MMIVSERNSTIELLISLIFRKCLLLENKVYVMLVIDMGTVSKRCEIEFYE